MRLHFTFVAAALASSTAAEVFKFPLPNGFPNIQPGPVLTAIEYQAGGPLPAAGTSDSELGADTKLPKEAAQALQGLAFNELFEVAFFTQLLQNVTVGCHKNTHHSLWTNSPFLRSNPSRGSNWGVITT